MWQWAKNIPYLTHEGKIYGIDEWLVPALVELLGEARGVAMLRCLKSEADTGKVRKIFAQVLQVGQQVLRVWRENQVRREAGR